MSLGAEIHLLWRKREAIRRHEEEIRKLKEEYHEIEAGIRRELVSQGVDSTRTARATVSLGKREVASIADYRRLERFIYEHEALDLLQSRPSITALRERRDAGVVVPGIEIETFPVLHMRNRG